jgi:hypothetical protein
MYAYMRYGLKYAGAAIFCLLLCTSLLYSQTCCSGGDPSVQQGEWNSADTHIPDAAGNILAFWQDK